MPKHAVPCLFALVSLSVLACTSRSAPLPRGDAGNDDAFVEDDTGAMDAFVARDASAVDAGHDAFAGHDGGSDAGMDAGMDAGHDAGSDAGSDAGTDTGIAIDAGRCRGGAHIGLYAADDLPAHQTVHDFLVPTGVLASVAIGGPVEDMAGPPMVAARIPPLSELVQFDAVFVWGSGGWDGNAFGDVLAQYVDQGGGVVIAVFAQRSGSAVGVAGAMLTQSYLPYVPSNYQFLPLTLGTVALPTHPIMQGVTSFSGSNIADHDGPLAPGATLVASWSNGMPLVGVMQPSAGRTALLGLYPVRFWDTSTDGARLMANTLLWAARCQ